MNNWQHHCAVLGIPEDANTSLIRRCYRRLALERHPDRHGGSTTAKEDFQRINSSYRYLLANFRNEAPRGFRSSRAPEGGGNTAKNQFWRETVGRAPDPAPKSAPPPPQPPREERRDPGRADRRAQERRSSTRTDRRRALEQKHDALEIRIPIPRWLPRLVALARAFVDKRIVAVHWVLGGILGLLLLRAVFHGVEGQLHGAGELSCQVGENQPRQLASIGVFSKPECRSRCEKWRGNRKQEAVACIWNGKEI